MRLLEIEKKARTLGIKDIWKFTKKDLIKAIQRREGNFDCYSSAKGTSCSQSACCWKEDCLR